ncbi:hypothetical protein AB0D00_26490 [Streptomyces sp. NPDC048213]|uniref:hypothetical protein n=1 Tax=Streptomyces sp. NPDC048213 TaxID=3160984 RepID=UPI0033E936EB
MGRNKDAVKLGEVLGLSYMQALKHLQDANRDEEGETLHQTAVRLISQAERAEPTG